MFTFKIKKYEIKIWVYYLNYKPKNQRNNKKKYYVIFKLGVERKNSKMCSNKS